MSHSSSFFWDDQRESSLEMVTECYADPDWSTDLATIRPADGRSGRTLRKSCDRCYQQKLRCGGDKTSLTRCTRCQRAGVECVYSARSSKQPNKSRNDSWDSGRTQPMTPSSASNTLNDLETRFNPDILHLDDIFPGIPSSWATAGTTDVSMHSAGLFSEDSTGTSSGVGLEDGPSDLSGRLANVCQALEVILQKVIKDHRNQATQDYPIGEVFNSFDDLLRVLAPEDVTGSNTLHTSETLFDEYLRSKEASMAAQCYILCMKLMVSLSEQMLQGLLASPLQTSGFTFSNSVLSEATQNANSLAAQEGTFSNTSNIPEDLKLGDLCGLRTDPFGHALNSTINMLQIGSRLLGKMEKLLGIPPELGGGSMSGIASSDAVGLDQQLRPSLPARFVASVWEDEASTTNKSAVTYFRRCRAAILGLTTHSP